MITDADIRELDAEVTRATAAGTLPASRRAISNYCAIALSESYSDEIRHRARVYLAAVLESRQAGDGSVVVNEDVIARGIPQ